jgi:phage internal scaffolding protein
MQFKTAFSDKVRYQTAFSDDSFVQQAAKDECDINNIMSKWQKTGLVSHVSSKSASYDSLIDADSYHNAMNQVIAADDAFNALPSVLRSKFDNDPIKFLSFVDSHNEGELIDFGLSKDSKSSLSSAGDSLDNSSDGSPTEDA